MTDQRTMTMPDGTVAYWDPSGPGWRSSPPASTKPTPADQAVTKAMAAEDQAKAAWGEAFRARQAFELGLSETDTALIGGRWTNPLHERATQHRLRKLLDAEAEAEQRYRDCGERTVLARQAAAGAAG